MGSEMCIRDRRHTEYDFFWNWEMDVRWTANYYTLFCNLAECADVQPLDGLWQHNTRFSIYSESNNHSSQLPPKTTSIPPLWPWSNAAYHSRTPNETDLITLFPIFDTDNTQWSHEDYLINLIADDVPTRFATVGTNMRLSRTMLHLMDSENNVGRAMTSEMWPPTLAYHHGLKAVYVPHPIYFDELWSTADLQSTFNGGMDGRLGGSSGSVLNRESVFARSSWYWDAQWPLMLYERWMRSGLSKDSKAGEVCLAVTTILYFD